jgi:hypothetical protein
MAEKKPTRPNARRTGRARAPFTLNARWALVVLAVLVAAFFHEVALEGRTFVSPDATAPAGFVRMGEQSLNHDHVYPLWNPFVFLGMPSFASGAYNPLIYPPDWPLALVQKVIPLPDMTWLLIYYALGAWFFFLLAREWGARPEGALLGAVAFIFAPNLVAVGSHGHGSQLVDSAYLPLMLWLASRWLRRGSLADLGALALAGGFQMLRGHVQICFYTWLAIGIYALVNVIASLRDRPTLTPKLVRAAAILGAAALAFGIAGFYNLPLRDYAHLSIRGSRADGGVGMNYATQWSFGLLELPTIVLPGWAGFGGQTYWGGMPFTDYPNAYVGMITVVLAIPAFLAGGTARVFALVLAAFSLLISFGHNAPFYGWLYDHLPLFNKFRIPVMIILLFQLAAALGAAWGWSSLLESPQQKGTDDARRRVLVASMAALALLLVVGGFAHDSWKSWYVHTAVSSHAGFPPQAAEIAYNGLVGDIVRVSLFGLVALAVAWLALARRLPAAAATAIALALLLFELWPVSGTVMKPVIGERTAHSLDAGRDDVVEYFEKAGPPGSFRVLPLEEFQSNRFAGFGVATLGGYHAAKPRLFQDLLDSNVVSHPIFMRLLNVRYVTLSQAIPNPPPYFKLAYQGAGGVVYENLLALPRATVIGRYRVAPSAAAILDSLKAGRNDPAELTWLDHDPQLTLGSVSGATANITSYRLNDLAIDVQSPGSALLRLSDLWYPDWVATVDDRPAPILKVDYLLRAVAVPAGSHHVRFRYESPSVRNGFMLSIASALVALALIAAGMWTARRARTSEAA